MRRSPMSDERIPAGTIVFTVEPDTVSSDWDPRAIPRRKWGVWGKIVDEHDSHGLCYDVEHADGSQGCYEPREFDLKRVPAWLTLEVWDSLGEWPDPHVHKSHKIPVSRRSLGRWRTRLGIPSCKAVAKEDRSVLVPHIQAQVYAWQKRFQVLKGWEIKVQHDPMADCRVKTIDTEKKRAVIFTCQGLPTDDSDELGVPKDYAVHEVLHVALDAVEAGGQREAESLIRDLCWLFTYGVMQEGQMVWPERTPKTVAEALHIGPTIKRMCMVLSVKDDRDHCERPNGHDGMCYTRGRHWGKGSHWNRETGDYVWEDHNHSRPDDLLS
jgi:hypothetical protein